MSQSLRYETHRRVSNILMTDNGVDGILSRVEEPRTIRAGVKVNF